MFDDKFFNKIYMIDDPRLFIKLYPEEKLVSYHDNLHLCTKFDKDDNIIIYSKASIEDGITIKEFFERREELYLTSHMQYDDNLELYYKDNVHLSVNLDAPNDGFSVSDNIWGSKTIGVVDKDNTFEDSIAKISNQLGLRDIAYMEYGDLIRKIDTNAIGKDRVHVHDWVKVIRED